jgi:hypothetical protein
MSQASINFANAATTMEQLGERHKQLVECANNPARFRSRSRNGKFTSRHPWTQGELTDLSLAYLRDCDTKSLHQIAEEINARFAEYLIRQDQEDESNDDAPLVGPEAALEHSPTEFRESLPSVTAIEMKLLDCAALYLKCENGKLLFGAKPSAMHVEIWQHLLQAQKHREIIRTMKEAPPEPSSRLGKVHRRKESECDREEFPQAKRRKLNPEDDDASNSCEKFMEMQELCKALDTIAGQVEEREQNRLHANAAIAQSLATIRRNKQDIELLARYIQDTQSGINKCVEQIDAELAKIETILHHAAPATPAPAPAPAPATKPKFDPSNYQCHECSQTFDPSIRGYWLIGAPCCTQTNDAQEHDDNDDDDDDMFYLCRECARFENEYNHSSGIDNDMAFGVMEDGEYDYDQYEDQCEQARREHYDHSEECS